MTSFVLSVSRVDRDKTSATFEVRSTQNARQIAVSRSFVLKTLARDGREGYAVCRALSAELEPLREEDREAHLQDLQTADRYITKTRITSVSNYIDWENIDHHDVLAKMLAVMEIPTSYHLEVFFRDPEHLGGITVGDRIESYESDGMTDGIEELLRADPSNIYIFKGCDENWRLSDLLAVGADDQRDDAIAWTNAQETIEGMTQGLLPWFDGVGWGAVDGDGAAIVPFEYGDVDYRDGLLHFEKDGRWISVAELR